MQRNWNELKHVLVHVIDFKRDWLKINFGHPRHLHYFVLKFRCFTTISPSEFKISGFFHCASVYVIVYQMWCCKFVSFQLDTIAEVLAGVTLSVNAFERWHARGPSRLARLFKDLTFAAASQAYVERIFSACRLLYSGRRVSRDERLHKTQTVLEETSFPR